MNDATLFMTLLAAFKVLLYRYTGQEDLLSVRRQRVVSQRSLRQPSATSSILSFCARHHTARFRLQNF